MNCRLSSAWPVLSAACALGCTHKLEFNTFKTKEYNFAIATFIENSINFGTDGSLYVELILNRTFQEEGSASYYTSSGGATLRQTTDHHLSSSVPNSVVVSPKGSSAFGLRNVRYFGIPVKAWTYKVSFYTRADKAAKVKAKAGLYAASNDKDYASVDVALRLLTHWQRYITDLASTQSVYASNNTFGLTFPAGSSVVQLNLISLFPTSTKALQVALIFPKRSSTSRRFAFACQAEISSRATRSQSSRTGPGASALSSTAQVCRRCRYRRLRSLRGSGLFKKIDSEPILGVYAGYSLNQAFVFQSDLALYV